MFFRAVEKTRQIVSLTLFQLPQADTLKSTKVYQFKIFTLTFEQTSCFDCQTGRIKKPVEVLIFDV